MAKHDKVLNYHFGQLGMSKLKINNYRTKKGRTNICNAKVEYEINIILKIRKRRYF